MRNRLELSHGTGWRRGAVGGTVAAVCALIAVTAYALIALSGTAAAVAPPNSTNDLFTGHVTSGTGAFAGDRGSVVIRLAPRATGAIRQLSLTFSPLSCRPKGRACLAVRGSATGSLARIGMPIPDVGLTLRLKASGRVHPLGRTVVTGMVRTVGFIARGHETLRLVLGSGRGSVTLTASSALVPGFTAP